MKTDLNDCAALLQRLVLGGVLVVHALTKFFVFTLAGTASFFESLGFPGWTAYIVAPAELLGGIALIAGFGTRWIALLLIPILSGALFAHAGNGFGFANPNGGWEYPLVLIASTLALALQGGGRFGFAQETGQADS